MKTTRRYFNPLLKSYPDSEKINSVSEGAEVLFVRLLAKSDDNDRFWGDATWILPKLFTSRMLAGTVRESEVEKRLVELEKVGLIERYEVNGKSYLQLVNCFKTFRSDQKTFDLRFPGTDTTQARYDNVTGTTQARAPNTKQNNTKQNNNNTDWSCVVDDLKKLGVGGSSNLIEMLQRAGLGPDYGLDLIKHYRSQPKAWSPAGLAWRMQNCLEDAPDSGWPPASEEAAKATRTIQNKAEQGRLAAERAKNASQREAILNQNRESLRRLEALSPEELQSLAHRALDSDMLRKRFRKNGLESQLACDAMIVCLDKEQAGGDV